MKAFFEPERLFKYAMWCIALLFSCFLVGLGSLLIRDLPSIGYELTPDQFHSAQMKSIDAERQIIQTKKDKLNEEIAVQNPILESATSSYDAEKTNFDNWISTRSATQSNEYNPEVVERTHKLELLKEKEQKVQQKINQINEQIAAENDAQLKLDQQYDSLSIESNQRYERAKFFQDLKVFFMRLALIMPLLVIAAWLFVKKRHSKYWPFVWGFIGFALFSFFVELVPYLPSYGGYIRYIVGLVLIGAAGYYGIGWMQEYLTKRSEEEQQTEVARRQKLNYEVAIKKVNMSICPSCERSVTISSGDLSPLQKPALTNFCMHCGLKLFQVCPNCDTRHNQFYQHCPCCGILVKESTAEFYEV